jgi:hypothetical protein
MFLLQNCQHQIDLQLSSLLFDNYRRTIDFNIKLDYLPLFSNPLFDLNEKNTFHDYGTKC